MNSYNSFILNGEDDPALRTLKEKVRLGYAYILDLDIDVDEDKKPLFLCRDRQLKEYLDVQLKNEGIEDRVRLAWLHCEKLGAQATAPIYENIQFIILNTSMFYELEKLCDALWASPTFWPEVGNVNLEIKNPPIKIRNCKPQVNIKPQCSVRSEMAECMQLTALWFLLNHEMTHAISGHHSSSLPIIEFDDGPAAKTVQSHTLEMDADAGAIVYTFNSLMADYHHNDLMSEYIRQYPIPIMIRKGFGHGPLAAANFLSCAMISLFCLSNPNIFDKGKFFEKSHPHPCIRQYMALLVLAGHIPRDYKNIDPKSITDLGTDNLRKIYKELDFEIGTQNIVGTLVGYVNAFPEYWDQLLACWRDELHPVLSARKIRKSKLAAPQ